MKLIKKSHTESTAEAPSAGRGADGKGVSLNRRAFLRNAGLTVGGVTLASQMVPGLVRKSEAATTVAVGDDVETKRTICGHCSVGCGIYAKVVTASGLGRSLPSTIRSTSAPIAPRARRCGTTVTASGA